MTHNLFPNAKGQVIMLPAQPESVVIDTTKTAVIVAAAFGSASPR